jgi:hypothetical protein
MLGNLALTFYLHFWSDHSARLQALYADWTLLDYAIKFYPVWLTVLGCVGLVMLRRWAVYVFGVFFALRLRECVLPFFREDSPDVSALIVWLPRVVLLLVPAIAFLYGLYLWKKGTFRKGWA